MGGVGSSRVRPSRRRRGSAPLILAVDGGWVDAGSEGDLGCLLPVGGGDLDHIPLFEGEPMAWLRCHILCPFVSLVENEDIFASDRLGLNACWPNA